MTTVSVSKRAGLTPYFERSFESVSDAARFAGSWLPMHVVVHDESGQPIDPYILIRAGKSKEPAVRPFKNPDGANAVCPFCGAPEAVILADDECLHACDTCDRAWYIDNERNVLPADRCPKCDSPDVHLDDRGARTCAACAHAYFFDGLTYVDPSTVEAEESEVSS